MLYITGQKEIRERDFNLRQKSHSKQRVQSVYIACHNDGADGEGSVSVTCHVSRKQGRQSERASGPA